MLDHPLEEISIQYVGSKIYLFLRSFWLHLAAMLLDQSLRGMSLIEWLVTSSLFAIFAVCICMLYIE